MARFSDIDSRGYRTVEAYNLREWDEYSRFAAVLAHVAGRRLTCKKLTGKAAKA